MSDKIGSHHLQRKAILYVRQSSSHQVIHNGESRRLQYANLVGRQRVAPRRLLQRGVGVAVGADDERAGRPVAALDFDDCNAGPLARKRDLDVADQLSVFFVAIEFHLPSSLRLDEVDVEVVDACQRVGLAEVGFEVERIDANFEFLDIARGDGDFRDLVGAESALGGDAERFLREHDDAGLGRLRP